MKKCDFPLDLFKLNSQIILSYLEFIIGGHYKNSYAEYTVVIVDSDGKL